MYGAESFSRTWSKKWRRYGVRSFVTAFTWAPNLSVFGAALLHSSLAQTVPLRLIIVYVHSLIHPSIYPTNHLSVRLSNLSICPSVCIVLHAPWFSKWSLYIRFPTKTLYAFCFSSCTPHAWSISSPSCYFVKNVPKLRSSYLCSFFKYHATSFPLYPNTFQHPVLNYPQPMFFSQYGSNFYTHTKQQAELWMCLLQFTISGDVRHDYFAVNSTALPTCASFRWAATELPFLPPFCRVDSRTCRLECESCCAEPSRSF
jgi:hypothetical protein